MPGENKRETGGRVLKGDPSYRPPDPLNTGDRGDEPRKPYGLTRRVDETEEKVRTSEGRSPARRGDQDSGSKGPKP